METLAGKFLRETRRRQGVSQEDLARRAGSHQPQVSAWETGRKPVTVAQLADLMDVLGLELRLSTQPKPRADAKPADAFSGVLGDRRGAPPAPPGRSHR